MKYNLLGQTGLYISALCLGTMTKVRIDAQDLKFLDDASQLPPEYPGWMIERQGQARVNAN